MKFAVIFLYALFSLTAAAQADRFDKVEIKTTRLTPNIYMLEGEGGNIGVSAGEDGVFVIDDQFAPLTPKILAKAGVVIVSHDNVRKRLSTKTPIDFFKSDYGPSPAAALPVITFADTV